MTDFIREHDRYVVLKRTDIEAHANVSDQIALGRIVATINTGRAGELKLPLRAVVVESDWPEYEPTWRAIEARMRGLNEPSGDSGQLPKAGAVARPMETAPRDGTMVRLLVQFDEHATEDAEGPAWTIGANNRDNTGDDEWQFAGWCWTHDQFTEGKGTPVGWLPMHDALSAQAGSA